MLKSSEIRIKRLLRDIRKSSFRPLLRAHRTFVRVLGVDLGLVHGPEAVEPEPGRPGFSASGSALWKNFHRNFVGVLLLIFFCATAMARSQKVRIVMRGCAARYWSSCVVC